MDDGIEDILTSQNCYKSYVISTPSMFNETLIGTKMHQNNSKLSVYCWVLVGLNVVQLCIIIVLLVMRFIGWKAKVQSSVTKIAQVPLEHDFEMIENEMYGASARNDG